MKTVIPIGTKIADVGTPVISEDIILSEAINIFFDAEDDEDEIMRSRSNR